MNLEEKRQEIEDLIPKANSQCKKIKDYIIGHYNMFRPMDLKLHTAFFYENEEMEKDFPLCYASNNGECSYFDMFCNVTYDMFQEWCDEERIDFQKMCHHIGRTSQFYLYEDEFIQRDNGKINWSCTMESILSELFYSGSYGSQSLEFSNGLVDKERSLIYNSDYYTEEEWLDELKPELEYIANNMYDDFQNAIEDVKKVYEYIKDTKENQVEYFKEFLDSYEYDLRIEKEEKDAEAAKKQSIVSELPESLKAIMKRSALDSEDLAAVLKECNSGSFSSASASSIIQKMSSSQKDEVYRQLWAEHVEEDVRARMTDTGAHLNDEAVQDVVHRYVYEGDYDCNHSYWDNLDSLIDDERDYEDYDEI